MNEEGSLYVLYAVDVHYIMVVCVLWKPLLVAFAG